MGFSQMGHDSFKHNRSQRNRRTSYKDNPYAANHTTSGQRDPAHLLEVQAWRHAKEDKEKKLRRLVFGILLPLLVLFAVMVQWTLRLGQHWDSFKLS